MTEPRARDPYIFVVDTHTLVWYVENSPKLGKNAERILSDPGSTLLIPSIVLAEARYLSAKRPLGASWSDVWKFVRSDHRVWIFPLDEDIVADMPLTLEMHDAIICAVCILYDEYLLEDAAVLTKDREIVDSGLVATIW